MRLDDAENIFEDEVRRLKKEKASLYEATKHKRLGKGNMRFPSDLMSRKEKIEHRRAGQIVTTNLYEKIIPINELKELEQHEQRNRLAYWRNIYSQKEIINGLGCGSKTYYDIVKALGLPKAPRSDSAGPKKERKKIAAIKVVKEQQEQLILPETVIQEPAAQPAAQPVQEIIVNGIHLVFNGTYQPEMIIKQLLKFGALLEDETDDYYIELKLVQKAAAK